MAFTHDTDPYGQLHFCIGSADDFWCFDYATDRSTGMVRIHAVINSETGSFIQDAEPPVEVSIDHAVETAQRLVDEAVDWMCDNEVEHDQEGWNQDTQFFVRSIRADLFHNNSAPRFED